MQVHQKGEALTTRGMKNRVHHLIFQLLSNFTEVRIEIPVSPIVTLDQPCFMYNQLEDSASDSLIYYNTRLTCLTHQ